jgi:hypothetical protein
LVHSKGLHGHGFLRREKEKFKDPGDSPWSGPFGAIRENGGLATMLFPTAGWLGFPVPAALSRGSGWGRLLLLFTVVFLIVIVHGLVLLLRTCRPSGPVRDVQRQEEHRFQYAPRP